MTGPFAVVRTQMTTETLMKDQLPKVAIRKDAAGAPVAVPAGNEAEVLKVHRDAGLELLLVTPSRSRKFL